MNSDYIVRHNLEENKIYIRKRSGAKEEKKIQIFSLHKEIPFLWAGSAHLSSEYDVWVSPGTPKDVPSWKEGYTVRILSETAIEQEITMRVNEDRTRVLFVTPHLSTGGCPQYLLKKIETYRDVLDIYVVEHSFLSPTYVVQRNKIRDLIGDHKFFSLGEDKAALVEIVKTVDPEIIHFEEIPESFLDNEITEKIYCQPERKYFITETTHSSESSPSSKYFLPDKFIFCSRFSQEKFRSLGIESEIWEYPIEDNARPERNSALKKLGLDPRKIHVLNVGLFTPGKNQGEIFEIAKNFSSENVEFHFVGNQAPNFEHYWGPLMSAKPSNCTVWGERNDIENFMSACDVFYFSSIFELNPLVVKEALSWKMPVLMYDLSTYMGSYEKMPGVHFLDKEKKIKENEALLRSILEGFGLKEFYSKRAKIVHIVSELFTEIEQTSIASVSALANDNPFLEYTIHYNPPTKEIPLGRETLYEHSQLKPGHFGCFEAFRKAITEDFSDEYDYLIACERDCVLEKPANEIVDLLKKTFEIMESEDVTYFSFGDKVNLDGGFLQSEKISELPGDFAYATNKIIGLQFIIFNKKGREFLREKFQDTGWHGMDIWLSEVYNRGQMKMGILNERVTTQLDGYSIIDDVEKKFI